jgi:hypothetical protein
MEKLKRLEQKMRRKRHRAQALAREKAEEEARKQKPGRWRDVNTHAPATVTSI